MRENGFVFLGIAVALGLNLWLLINWKKDIQSRLKKDPGAAPARRLGIFPPAFSENRRAFFRRIRQWMSGRFPAVERVWEIVNTPAESEIVQGDSAQPRSTAPSAVRPAPLAVRLKKILTFEFNLPFVLKTAFEICVLLAFTLWIGKKYLNLDPTLFLGGHDYPHAVYNHFIWEWWGDCGSCILWNGGIDGGDPSFANIQDAAQHPLVILTTLIWGVINGSKILIVLILFLGGLAQWWLARELGLGRLARIWCGLLAIAGPQYGVRMENGLLTLALSTTCAALMLPLIVRLLKRGPDPRAAVGLGGLFALTLLSGQGYIQLAFLFGVCPLILVFLLDSGGLFRLKPAWKSFVQAAVIGTLIAAILLVPYAHFLPYFTKDGNLGLDFSPAFREIPASLLDPNYEPIGTSFFLGWGVLFFAGLGLSIAPRKERRWVGFCALSAGLIILISNASFLKWIYPLIPSVDKIRFPHLGQGLAAPLIFALCGFGLDQALRWCNRLAARLAAAWLILLRPLALSILVLAGATAWKMGSINTPYFFLTHFEPGDLSSLEDLRTDSLEWVEPFYGDFRNDFILQLNGLKITNAYRPWRWDDRQDPAPLLVATKDDAVGRPELFAVRDGYAILAFPENQYSRVETDIGMVPCTAQGKGGKIKVVCNTPLAGVLYVEENYFPGWKAKIDGQPAALIEGQRLAIQAAAGQHTYTFTYDPWDVKLGAILSLLGILLSIALLYIHARDAKIQSDRICQSG